ncbi:MAG: SpoIIE family protein phosphatase [Succinivibrionaceae bacterium]|nr:SpoIIE family protein phosphatase [Succinivibrionaceae bacterium]
MSDDNSEESSEKPSKSVPTVSKVVLRSTAVGSVILAVVALLVGLAMYAIALTNQYITLSYNLARTASLALSKQVDELEVITNSVMERYHSLSAEDREKTFTEDYRRNYLDIFAGDSYQDIRELMNQFLNDSDLFGVYIGVYDARTKALVYIIDPDENLATGTYPGDWEPVEDHELDEFLNWNMDTKTYSIANTEKWGWICTSGYPIRNANGDIVAFVLTDVSLHELVTGIKSFIIQFTLAMLAVIALLAVMSVYHLRKKVVLPINAIADAATTYANDKKNGNEVGNHFENLNIKSVFELKKLGELMAKMEDYISLHEKNIQEMTAKNQRIETELSLATRIQSDMLPSEYPAFPDRDDFDIYARMVPAKEVGGDFYDYFLLDNSHLVMMIADVSGKGVPAALFMMMAKLLLRNAAMEGMSPSAALTEVNEAICRNNREEMFVTVWLGILDLSTGVLTAANAGHEFPILCRSNGNYEAVKDKHDFVIGGMPGIKYRQYELHLEPGCRLFLYTDGVAEATSSSLNLFGLDEIVDTLNQRTDLAPKDICDAVYDGVIEFVQGAPQFDDITMMSIHYKKRYELKESDMPLRRMTVKSTIDQLEPVTGMVLDFLNEQDCPKREKHQICVVIDEIFSNIVNYSYVPEVGDVDIEIKVEQNPTAVSVRFSDGGKKFNPLEVSDPDVSLSAEERDVGGLGIMMVKKLMDGVSYEYKEQKNVLSIKKFL